MPTKCFTSLKLLFTLFLLYHERWGDCPTFLVPYTNRPKVYTELISDSEHNDISSQNGQSVQSPTLLSHIFRSSWPFRVIFPDNRREDQPSEWIQSGWSDPAPSFRNKQSNQLHVRGMFFDWFVNTTSSQWNIYEIVQECPFSTLGVCKCSEEKTMSGSKSFLWRCCWRFMFILQCMLMLIWWLVVYSLLYG